MNIIDKFLHFIGARDAALDRRLKVESPIARMWIAGFRVGVLIGMIAVGLHFLKI
ncbi:hypothetical protein JCM17844_06840 [Iodidimonas gelatinilytica]|uniref:Uncharacterized protein n=1 Tax=Iodidimonas gelatinilytica TaxID=1236966 RepID=A0A5A7MM66_9PROT|nr:hypothetical protein JCM17844_06840 [Iodidimonas gelatinilytica]